MIIVNDVHYSSDYFARQGEKLAKLNLPKAAENSALAVCLEDTACWLALCLYARSNGISLMPLHPAIPLPRAKQLAENAGCQVLYYQNMEHALKIDTAVSQSAEAGLIQMSSGTTGEPKIIKRKWTSIEIEIQNYVEVFKKPESMTPVIACPITHSYGLICGVLVALARGQTPVIVTNINPKYLIKTLINSSRPLLYSSPGLLQTLLQLWPSQTPLHAAMTSGSTISDKVFKQISRHVSHMFQQYGCSEAGCISINQNMTQADELGTLLPHHELSENDASEQPQEIVIKGRGDDSKQVISTQDLGYISKNENGETRLRFASRLDDTIIVSGLNVYPQEIENLILSHADIRDTVVFKVEDEYAGERVCLQFTADKSMDIKELRSWCAAHMAVFQVPHYLTQVPSIARMENGKINRKQLALNFLQMSKTHSHSNTGTAHKHLA